MRQFSSSGFRLWNLSLEAKVLYTAFCLMTLAGILSSALYYGELVGARPSGIRRYYAGEPDGADAPPIDAPATGGPRIELPVEAAPGAPIVVPVTYRKLLEVTHFHLFTMPVVLLIIGHLFFATGVSDRAKLWWMVAASLAVAGHLATPWLVRYASPRLALLHALTGAALTLTMTVLTGGPVLAMWRPRPVKKVGGGGGGAPGGATDARASDPD
jgi:hypothetical protein